MLTKAEGRFGSKQFSRGLIPEGVASMQISQTLGEGLDDARELDDSVISEAAQMAVCWSRAWGSGGAAATAFHARSSQVSKTTETGESLARGSFVVRGERSWHKDVPLEVAIGLAVVNGVPMPVSGVPVPSQKSAKDGPEYLRGERKRKQWPIKSPNQQGYPRRMYCPVFRQGLFSRR